MNNKALTWAIIIAALASFAIALVRVGVMPHLDYPLITLSVTAVLAVFCLGREHVDRLPKWRFAWALAAMLAWALISALASGRVFSALFGNPTNGWGWLTMAVSAVIVLAAVGRRRAVRDALVAVAPWVVLVESGFATYQWSTKIWPAGTMSNPSYLLLVLGVFLPLAAATPQGAPTWQKRLRQASLLAGVWTVGISGARVGFVLVALWLLWALWSGTVAEEVPARARRIALVVLAVIAVPAGIWSYLSGGVGLGGFLSDRAARFSAAFQAMAQRPVAGWGPDGFFVGASPHVTKAMLVTSGSDFGQFGSDPHNFVAWTAASLGAVGLALLLWLAFEVGRNWFKQWRGGVLDSALAWGFALYALQALFAPAAVQTVPLAALVFGASLAVERSSAKTGAAVSASRKKSVKRPRSAGELAWEWSVRAAGVICAVVLLAYAGTRASMKESPAEANRASVESAARFWSDPYLWDFVYRCDAQSDSSTGSGIEPAQKAVDLEPDNAVYLTDLAQAKELSGASDQQVQAAWDAAYDAFPLSPDARSAYAVYLIATKQPQKAFQQLRPVRDVQSLSVWSALSTYYDAVGDAANAKVYQAKMTARLQAQDW